MRCMSEERKMRVGLIYLPHPYLNQPDAQAPIGLLYIAAIIEKYCKDVEVNIFNLSSYKSTEEAIKALPYCNLYGITITSLELLQANRFSKQLKNKYPECKIILGGPGTSTAEFVDWNYIDSICIGEAENAIPTIIDNLITYNKMESIYSFYPLENLDDIPFPARHLLGTNQGGNIFAYNKKYHGTKSTIILSSRGCPFKCPFCSSMFISGKLRFRSPESVYSEIKEIKKRFDIYQFRFSDDMFTANVDRTIEICSLIKPLNLAWRISTRVKPFTRELAEELYSAGCKEISFGVESFDDHVLEILDKKTTAEDNIKAIITAKNAGMIVRLLFMIKTPGQRKETTYINIKHLEKLKNYYDIVACTTFMPIPGSLIWKDPGKYGITILNKNLDDYNFYSYDSFGEIGIKNIISLHNRNQDEVNKESQLFKNYLKSIGKLNQG